MKTNKLHLISLNIWGGYVTKPFLDFIRIHQEVDIFCFQEVYKNHSNITDYDKFFNHNIYEEIEKLLPNHVGHFRPFLGDTYGIAVFLRNGIDVLEDGHINIYIGGTPSAEHLASHPRDLQWLKCRANDNIFTLMNVHGLWSSRSMGKIDSEERLIQSSIIKKFLDTVDTPKILCGDFNLRPDTESIRIIAEGMNNLIQQHGIVSTRSNLYKKDEKYADYIFTSPEINTIDFRIWNDTVSDHSPLSLMFSVG